MKTQGGLRPPRAVLVTYHRSQSYRCDGDNLLGGVNLHPYRVRELHLMGAQLGLAATSTVTLCVCG